MNNYFSYDIFWIYLVLLILLLYVWVIFLKRFLFPQIIVPVSRLTYISRLQKIFIHATLLVLCITQFNIGIISWRELKTVSSTPIQILFDVSLSMTADDIKPSRFEAAKSSLSKLVEGLNGYNVSVIVFSGIPFVWSLFSDKTSAVSQKISSMSLSDFPPTTDFVGTAIGDAIILGIDSIQKFIKKPDQAAVIILLTDWDSNKWADPLQAVKIANKYNTKIYTLWIWSNDYVVWHDYFGNPVTTIINIDLLNKISENSWWKFYRVLQDQDFEEIFNEIRNILEKESSQVAVPKYFYINGVLYGILFILLLLQGIILICSYIFWKDKKM